MSVKMLLAICQHFQGASHSKTIMNKSSLFAPPRMINADVTPVASGGQRNPYPFPGTPMPGVSQYPPYPETPSEQQFNIPPPDVPTYVNNCNDVTPTGLGTRYQEV